jgi:hypothetical protein
MKDRVKFYIKLLIKKSYNQEFNIINEDDCVIF